MKNRETVEVLLSTSDLQVLAAETAWKHIDSEALDVVDEVLATLSPSGPYAYTIGAVMEQGKEVPTQRIVSTYEQISAAYHELHRDIVVGELRPLLEIHGSWYVFVHGSGKARNKATGQTGDGPVVVLFPTMGSAGITGELYWVRTQHDVIAGDPADGSLASRFAVGRLHGTLIDAYRKGDLDTIVEQSHAEIQTAVRDYVSQSGTLVELHGKGDLQAHLQNFYAHYSVRGIDVVHQYVDEWFMFDELRWTVEALQGPDAGAVFRYHTAEFAPVSSTGVLAHIGHGTDQIRIG